MIGTVFRIGVPPPAEKATIANSLTLVEIIIGRSGVAGFQAKYQRPNERQTKIID